ncbi:MAG: aldose epimerase family protein [Ginsengibacter sp.]
MNEVSSKVLIEKKDWGSINGKPVYLFCLQNKIGTRLYLSNIGAAAQALIVRNKFNRDTDILLGYDNSLAYKHDTFYLGTVIGRYANRIAGSDVFIENKKYMLPVWEGGYHLHGGKEGFNKKVFDYNIKGGEYPSIEMSYTSVDMEEGFPGKLDLKITYSLDNDNRWIIEYECKTDKPTLVNLTQHAYFNLKGHNKGEVLNHLVAIHSKHYLPVNKLQVPTGEIADVKNTPFDFTEHEYIGKHINDVHEQLVLSSGYDHSWVLKKTASGDLVRAVNVQELSGGINLDVYTTEPAVHFYTGNFLNGLQGKDNAIYNSRNGFCLETQHYPDAPNKPHFPSTLLKPGENFYSKTVYALSVKNS